MREYQYANLILSSKEIKKLVNTDVSVETNNNECIRGFLKTVDPVSHTLVLQFQSKNEKQISLLLITGHSIKKIVVHDKKIEELDRSSFEQFILRKLQLTSIDTIRETQERIFKVLEKNKFPCKLDELDRSIVVSEVCKIKSPYREEDIECANYKVSKNLKLLLKDALLKNE